MPSYPSLLTCDLKDIAQRPFDVRLSFRSSDGEPKVIGRGLHRQPWDVAHIFKHIIYGSVAFLITQRCFNDWVLGYLLNSD